MESLNSMLKEIDGASDLYKPSLVWIPLTQSHLEDLRKYGIENFKRTVNNYYTQWIVVEKENIIFKHVENQARFLTDIEENHVDKSEDFLANEFLENYRLYVENLYKIILSKDSLGLLSKLSEPIIGNPIRIRQGDRYISQDLAIAYSDFLTLVENLGKNYFTSSITIAEIGAGYGCLASLFGGLSKARYFIIDIPPALYVAQSYIKELFKNEMIFEFRSFSSIDEINEELSKCRFAFFTPNQIEMLKDASIDIFVNINSFGEMTKPQVNNYMKHAWRLSQDAIYLRNYYDGVAAHGGQSFLRPPRSTYSCIEGWMSVMEEEAELMPIFDNGGPQIKTLYRKKVKGQL
jgi:putative sugar O-methyltransferase